MKKRHLFLFFQALASLSAQAQQVIKHRQKRKNEDAKILNRYRNKVSPLIYDVVENDLYSKNKLSMLSTFSLWWPAAIANTDSQQHQLFKDFFYREIVSDTLHTSVESKEVSSGCMNNQIYNRVYEGRMAFLNLNSELIDEYPGIITSN